MYRVQIIPLFQLSRVLFPKMILPLHIYEEQYKQMIADCLENHAHLGMISNIGSQLNSVGTAASINKVIKKYDDGRYDLLVLGENRFQLKSRISGTPFPMGEVEFFDDLPYETTPQESIAELLQLYWRFISQLGLKKEQRNHLETVVSQLDVEREISYIIGQTIGLDNSRQLKLLQETSSRNRVGRLTSELQRLKSVHNIAREMFENDMFDPRLN